MAECAKTFKPKYLYMQHHDLRLVGEQLKGTGIAFWDRWNPKCPPEPPIRFRPRPLLIGQQTTRSATSDWPDVKPATLTVYVYLKEGLPSLLAR